MKDKWERLRDELVYLKEQGVDTIHPAIILAFMTFLEEFEKAQQA